MANMDKNNAITHTKPFGSNVKVSYDNFFKSITITYYDENNVLSALKYSFISNNENDIHRCRMENKGSVFETHNYLSEKGMLVFISEKEFGDKNKAVFIVKNAVKK